MTSVALFLTAALLLPPPSPQLALEPAVVKVEGEGAGARWTVRAQECSARALLERVAALAGRSLEGQDSLERVGLITVALDGRPLEQVLEYALGGVGLRAVLAPVSIAVGADETREETPDERAALASAAWQRAAACFPHHPDAAAATLAQGELEELRGRREVARSRYLDLLARDPRSASAAEAYLRAGRIAAERGDWGEASEHFRALANLPGAEEYQALSRVELARATLSLGDARSTLHILEALDRSHPSRERTEVTARTLLRVEALLADGRFQDALFELETRGRALDPLGAKEAPVLRARALEGANLVDEASRAWLLVARGTEGRSRARAFEKAATLALGARDELGCLFIVREARTLGLGAIVAAQEREARERLGVPVEEVEDGSRGSAERLAQAELWLARSRLDEATALFEELFRERATLALDPEQRARVALGWARCVRESSGIEAALAILSAERAQLASDARARLDLGTARLLEDSGLFERAADAYQGDY